ncbi:MAG: AAA family ATPase [Magnetococcales bacterium]|nr:AAA family ATPase [Magnetococcales bacterium]MBF0116370.1 AAA family ATPase [Magnetococcales bacterium]
MRFSVVRPLQGNRPEMPPFFTVRSHASLWRALRAAVSKGEGVIVLTGHEGVGKSQLLLRLRSLLPDMWDMVLVNDAGQPLAAFTQAICESVGVEVAGPNSWSMTVEEILDALSSRVEFGRNILLVVDDAQDITQENLNVLNSLLLFSASHGTPLQILLSGRPELNQYLEHAAFQLLRNATIATLSLVPLTRLEVREYVHYQARRMMGVVPRMTLPAWLELYAASQGIPGAIDRLLHEMVFSHPKMPTRWLTGLAVRKGRMAVDPHYHPVPGRSAAPWIAALLPVWLLISVFVPNALLPAIPVPSFSALVHWSGLSMPHWPWAHPQEGDAAPAVTATASSVPSAATGAVGGAATVLADSEAQTDQTEGTLGVVSWEGTVHKTSEAGANRALGEALPLPEVAPMRRQRTTAGQKN